MNIAYYNHALPPVDEMLFVSTPDWNKKTSEIVEKWTNSEIDAFIVVGVTDEQIRKLYSAVKLRADVIVAQMNNTFETDCCDTRLKRLYRFDTMTSAKRYIDFLMTYPEDDFDDRDEYEDFMRDKIEAWFYYEEPWIFARELTERDWETDGLFYKELHSCLDCFMS
mgnify:CR=1 FL=1